VVVWLSAKVADALLQAPVAGRYIGLHADDRPDPSFLGFFLELPRPVQVTVIRDGEGGLLELQSPRDQVIYAVGTV
jgi:hypothetical protein